MHRNYKKKSASAKRVIKLNQFNCETFQARIGDDQLTDVQGDIRGRRNQFIMQR